MAKSSKKKVVVTTKKREKLSPTTSSRQAPKAQAEALLFGRENFLWMLGGIALIIVGMLLMSGGEMPSDDVWDENIIYSARRTLLAPIVILAGLVINFLAIFRNS